MRQRQSGQLVYGCLLAAALTALAARETFAQDEFRGRLQVTTYNIHHGTGNDACTPPPVSVPPQTECGFNLERVAATIRSFDSDVVALQEVDRFWARSGYTDQPAFLGQALGMFTCYAPNLDHQPDSHSTLPHQYGTLILSRYPITTCNNTLLPRPSGTEQRGLLEAVISVEDTPVRVYNTHLHTTIPARELQTQAIPSLIGTPAEPVVLMGDFNARPNAAEMAPIYAQFEDAWSLGGEGSGFTFPAAPDAEPNRRIDYVFLSRGNVAVVSAAVTLNDETRMTADHLPLTAKVRFP
jgi:endonuclease/exonuclease/phosphatase family metal-dependent hydrolase